MNNLVKSVMEKYKKITVYGLSPDESKPSHRVPVFMKSHGYDVVGVYPKGTDTKGMKIYQSLADVPAEYRKFLDVFRRSENIPELVDEVIKVGGVEVLWLQLGITHPEAEEKARKHGIQVISNKCLHIEYEKYF